MARIRTIKPEFWASEQIMECSRNARLLFIGLWNFCDDHGRAPWKPRQIKAQVFPGDDDVSVDDVTGWLQELSTNDLIMRYAVDGVDYFVVTGWHHQRIDKPQKPKCPAPPQDHSANDPGPFPPDRKGKEGKGRERNGAEQTRAPEPATASDAAPPGCVALDGFGVWELWQQRREAHGHGSSPNPPSPAEVQAAQKWLNAGADAELIRQAFDAALGRQDRQPPRSLRYCDEAVKEALAIKRDPFVLPSYLRRDKSAAEVDRSPEAYRRAREHSFRQTGMWLDEWGEKPELETTA